MNNGDLIFTLPAWQKSLVRKTEKENKKIANTESSLVYNNVATTCLKENLLPTYTNILLCILGLYLYALFLKILTVTWVILLLNASLLQLFDCCSKCALFDSTFIFFFFFFSGTVYSAFAWIRHWECRRM